MSSFSTDRFKKIDDRVFKVLGDDITVTTTADVEHTHKGEFFDIPDENELLDRVDDVNPYIEIQNKYSGLYFKGSLVSVSGQSYEFDGKHPKDSNTTRVNLKDAAERANW